MNKHYYLTRYKFDPKRNTVWKEIASYLQAFVPLGAKVLDLGAGYCCFINNIQAKERYALDSFAELAKYAAPGVITHQQTATDLSNFENASFDLVFCSNFLEHFSYEEIEILIKEIRRILKKEGRFIIIQPNFRYSYHSYFDDYTHKTIHTDLSLTEYLKAKGFFIEKLKPKFLPFSMNTRLPKIGFLVKMYLYSPIKPWGKQMLIIAKKIN